MRVSLLLFVSLAACTSQEVDVSSALTAACPASAPDDAAALAECSSALKVLPELQNQMAAPVLWGGQPKDMSIEAVPVDAKLTEFNPLVWRGVYLSLYSFEEGETIEEAGEYTVLRKPARFRNMLEAGLYPYPFWHSMDKWKSYETSPELLFYFKDGVVSTVVRAAEVDTTRAQTTREWSGEWTVDGQEPKAALYRELFSADNPHVQKLEDDYRNLASELRKHSCFTCHSPDNSAGMKHLELLNYPNQALAGRHDIVRMIDENSMPPGVGIPDLEERASIRELATNFASTGDLALVHEGETVP
jgi:hypothetical protein